MPSINIWRYIPFLKKDPRRPTKMPSMQRLCSSACMKPKIVGTTAEECTAVFGGQWSSVARGYCLEHDPGDKAFQISLRVRQKWRLSIGCCSRFRLKSGYLHHTLRSTYIYYTKSAFFPHTYRNVKRRRGQKPSKPSKPSLRSTS